MVFKHLLLGFSCPCNQASEYWTAFQIIKKVDNLSSFQLPNNPTIVCYSNGDLKSELVNYSDTHCECYFKFKINVKGSIIRETTKYQLTERNLTWSVSHLSRLRYSLFAARTAKSMTKGPTFAVKRTESAFWKTKMKKTEYRHKKKPNKQ